MLSGLLKYLVGGGVTSERGTGGEGGATMAAERGRHSQVVEEAEANSKEHVDDPQDDGHLHLEGVQEGQLVDGDVPDLGRKGNYLIFGAQLVKTEPSQCFGGQAWREKKLKSMACAIFD